MKILSKNHSTYPRIGDKPQQQRLRRAYHQFDKNEITATALQQVLEQTIEEIVHEQLAAGVSYVTDGLLPAWDPVSYVAEKIEGFTSGGLLRFFDTNFYFRQPKVVSPLRRKNHIVAEDFARVKKMAGPQASLSFTGPYSLIKLSKAENFDKDLQDLVGIYAEELRHLHDVGAPFVQLEEPAILQHPEDMPVFTSIYRALGANQPRPEMQIAFYFGNCTPMVDDLADLNVEGLVFDFTYSPNLLDALPGLTKDIGLGIIDGRNTRLENVAHLAKTSEKVLRDIRSEKVYVTTSCGLEFLPRDRAFEKLKLCAALADIFNRGLDVK